MSSTYFIGTYEKGTGGDYFINKPITLTGISFSFLQDILENSCIDIYNDFLFFSDNNLFFYTIDSSWSGPLNEKYEDCYIDDIDLDEIPSEMYPLICDGVERDGYKFFIRKDEDKPFDYSNFKKLTLTNETTRLYISENDYYYNNHEDIFIEELMKAYNVIARWIENNQPIYLYRYY